jgi:hypothetical protein
MMTRRLPRIPSLVPACAAVALVGLVLAGCGSSDSANAVAGAAGTDGRAAKAFPASTAAFLSANIDESSTGWKQLLALGARFPSWPKFAGQIQKGMSGQTGGDAPTVAQLRSWLGPEVAVGVLAVPADGSDPSVLGFAEVRDRGQLEAALKQDKDTKALGKSGDYDLFGNGAKATIAISPDTALLANSRATVDAAIARLGGTGDSLAEAPAFTDTMSKLATDNIVVGYAPGSTLPKLVAMGRKSAQGITQAQIGGQLTSQLAAVRSLGFSFGATDKGLRIRGTTLLNADAGSLPADYSPTLLDRIPASSWLAASFGDVGANAKNAVDQALAANPDAKTGAQQVQALLGVSLDDIYALLGGEHALYAGPGAPVSAGLILHPSDPARGATTLRALTRLLSQQGTKVSDTSDGQSAVIQGFTARWRTVDDDIGVGTDAAVGNATKDSIVDSDKFKRVLAEDGVDSGSKTLGLVYVDVPSLVNLASAFGSFNGAANAETLENLKHVGGVLLWAGRDGDTVVSDLFVEST